MKNNKKPNLGSIQEFGVAAYVKDLKAGKLDARAQLGRFVGYDSESKGYRIYWPSKRSISVERNVTFNKKDVLTTDNSTTISGDVVTEGERDKIIHNINNKPQSNDKLEDQPTNSQQPIDKPPEPQPDEHPSNSIPFPSLAEPLTEPDLEATKDDDEASYGRGQRPRKPKGAYKTMNEGLVAAFTQSQHLDDDKESITELTELGDDSYEELPPDLALLGSVNAEPCSLDEALRGPNSKDWQEALDYEIRQLEKLGTWVIEDLPPGHKAIPCSEVLKLKRGPNGEVQSYRVRIVAGGHKQVEGVNYTETFSAAAKMPAVRVVLANAAEQNWEIEHVDVKSAYLNAPLEEVIYMKPPRGVLKPGQEGKYCRLLKGLYGLKQAGRGWYLEMSKVFLKELGFERSAVDHSVFFRRSNVEHTIVAVATDDMAVTSKRMEDAKRFKLEISKFWEITDNGPIKWFLGFQIKRDRTARTISINQHAYIESMVERFELTEAKPVSTPMVTGAQFSIEQGPATANQAARMRGVPYAEAIGSVLWPVVVSRPDAAYAVGILSQFIQNPGPPHWEALKRVIIYLGSTKDLWLTFGGPTKTLVKGFCDADWASQKHRHSISGYSFHFGRGAISWSSKKQHIVALSSTEAEYIAQTHAAKEALWLRSFVKEIREERNGTLTINCDNQGAIALAKDNKFHSRTKHIDLRYHFIREAVEDKKISVNYIPTDDNISDIFTKPLSKQKFRRFVEMLGLANEGEAKTKERSREV